MKVASFQKSFEKGVSKELASTVDWMHLDWKEKALKYKDNLENTRRNEMENILQLRRKTLRQVKQK